MSSDKKTMKLQSQHKVRIPSAQKLGRNLHLLQFYFLVLITYLPLFQNGTTPTAWFSSKRNTLSNLCCLDASEMMTGCATLSFVLDQLMPCGCLHNKHFKSTQRNIFYICLCYVRFYFIKTLPMTLSQMSDLTLACSNILIFSSVIETANRERIE